MRFRPDVPAPVALAAALLLVCACSTKVAPSTAGTTAAPPSTAGSATSMAAGTSTTVAAAPTLRWSPCDQDFECATLDVPADYDHPAGASLRLALVKVAAQDPAHRIGSLLVNPGGPGGSGIDLAEGNVWPTQIRQRFDIIGFDPRGVGRSTPLECHATLAHMYAADPAPRTTARIADLLARSRAFVKGCATRYGTLLPLLGTRNVARDMDRIRVALGEQKLNYLGYSYGTSIGQVYADLFPTNVRAMVLDGIVRLGQPGLEAATQQGESFERNLTAFEEDCKQKSTCPIGPDPAAVIARVRAKVDTAPIPATGADRPLGPGEFQLGVGQALYATYQWPTLARALQKAEQGDGTAIVDLADQYLERNPDGSYANGFEIYFAVSCLDWDWPTDPEAYLAAGRAAAKTAPVLGEGIVTDYVRCAYWPARPQPLRVPKAIGSPPIVVVSTTNDPATPYQDGVDLAELLPHGVLITHRGSGHTIYGQGDTCVDNAVDRYLLTLAPPGNGLVCS